MKDERKKWTPQELTEHRASIVWLAVGQLATQESLNPPYPSYSRSLSCLEIRKQTPGNGTTKGQMIGVWVCCSLVVNMWWCCMWLLICRAR